MKWRRLRVTTIRCSAIAKASMFASGTARPDLPLSAVVKTSCAGPPAREEGCSRWYSTEPSATPFGWRVFIARSLPSVRGHRPAHWQDPRPATSDSSARSAGVFNLLPGMHDSGSIPQLQVTVAGQAYHSFRSLVETTTGWMPNDEAQLRGRFVASSAVAPDRVKTRSFRNMHQ
jgi:hypothetical protein